MATKPAEQAPGAEPETNEPPAQAPGGEPQTPETDEPGPYDDLARKMGWTPKGEFQGPAEAWKDAETFITDGRDIQRGYAAELKALRTTVDNISRTSQQMVETTVAQREQELIERYNQAVEDGKGADAFKLAGEIHALKAPQAQPAPPAESVLFAERNAWFKRGPADSGDPLATSLAIDVCNRLAAQGYDTATQLEAAEREVKRQYPHLFQGGLNGKPPAGVNAPGNRGPANRAGQPKGFADMPLESQKVANEMAGRLSAADPEGFKTRFAKNYWQNAEGKA